MNSYFYLQAEKNQNNASLIDELNDYSKVNKKLIYILDRPLTDQKYSYNFKDCLIVLSPNNKITLINLAGVSDDFEDYIEDIIEDIGTISDKYDYKAIIGRPRKWRNDLIEIYDSKNELPNVADLFSETLTEDPNEIKE